MSKSIMAALALAIKSSGAAYDPDADMPLPNIYLASVYPFNKPAISAYVAADHTNSALQKVSRAVAESHNFRPLRSNSVIRLRRMKLGDIIDDPDAYTAALLAAKASGESDVLSALRKLPEWIAATTGVPIPPVESATLWGAFADALSALPGLSAR